MRELVFRTAIYIAPIILCRMKFCAIGGCALPPGCGMPGALTFGIWPGCITGRPGIGAAIGPPAPGCIVIPGPVRIARLLMPGICPTTGIPGIPGRIGIAFEIGPPKARCAKMFCCG